MATFKFDFGQLEQEKDIHDDGNDKEVSTKSNANENNTDSAAVTHPSLLIDTTTKPPLCILDTRALLLEDRTNNAEAITEKVILESVVSLKPVLFQNSKTQEENDSDIIPGVYEGGLKVWECSLDLCHYLAEQISLLDDENQTINNDCSRAFLPGGTTLELGCGHGLPGCLMLRELCNFHHQTRSSSPLPKVLFSDYNEFVLRDTTWTNIRLNTQHSCDEEPLNDMVELIAGDWMDLSKHLTSPSSNISDRFDLILSAETTYTPQASAETALFLLHHLKFNVGIGLIATKRYYFGVGGGLACFQNALNDLKIEQDGVEYSLISENIREYDCGVGNIRDLLKVRCVSSAL